MKTLIITRDLTNDSPINTLASKNVKVEGKSFIQFEQVDFDTWSHQADWVFFYSKNGVKFSFNNRTFLQFCQTRKIGTYGQMTADFIHQHSGIIPDFIGNGKRDTTLLNYLKQLPDQTLFVQGDRSLKALQSNPGFDLPYSEVITYRSLPLHHRLHTPSDIIVFTSPLNVEYYTQHIDLLPTQSLWAIGDTTATALRQKTDSEINVASNPSEEILAKEIAASLKT